MKVDAVMSNNDEDLIEAEIESQLKNLILEDGCDFEDGSSDDIDQYVPVMENIELSDNSDSEPIFENLAKINWQTEMASSELNECDLILQESDLITSSRKQNPPDSFLQAVAKNEGLDVETLTQKILLEIDEHESQDIKLLEEEDDAEDSENSRSNPVESTSNADIETLSSIKLSNDGQEFTSDNPGIANDEDSENDLSLMAVHLKDQLKELLTTQTEKETKRKQFEENFKQNEQMISNAVQIKRKEKMQEMENEENRLNKEKQIREAIFAEEQKVVKDEMERMLEQSELKINLLVEKTRKETENFQKFLKAEEMRKELQMNKSATLIQALFRGYRIRQQFGEEVKKRIAAYKDEKTKEKIKILEEAKRFKEEQQMKIEEENKKRKEEEEENRRKKEEEEKRLNIEEENKKKKEEEKRLKIEEENKRKKEEEKRLKIEEENKRKKEEEKRLKIEEENRKKREEEKQFKIEEENKRKKEEEKKKQELMEKKVEQSMIKNNQQEQGSKINNESEKTTNETETGTLVKHLEEENVRNNDVKNNLDSQETGNEEKNEREKEKQREREEQQKYEERRRKEELKRQELAKKLEEEKRQEIAKKIEEEKRQEAAKKIEEEKRQEAAKRKEEEKRQEAARKMEEDKRNEAAKRKADENMFNEEAKKKTFEDNKRAMNSSDFSIKKVMQNEAEMNKRDGIDELHEKSELESRSSARRLTEKGLNTTRHSVANGEEIVEKRRQQWIEECQPWAKSSRKQRTVKPSQKPLHIPSSAKKLPVLDDGLILTASFMTSLQQVTTLELEDLPGFSTKPLSKCVNLSCLSMKNCNLIAVEGLDKMSSLRYVDLRHNKLQLINFDESANLVYLDVSHNVLPNIHGLFGCSQLRHLNLSHNKITRISGLESQIKLHTLILSDNQLITSKGLVDVPTVQVLDLSRNHLPVLDGIEHLGLLQTLDCRNNNLIAVPLLTNQVLLTELLLDDNSIISTAGLEEAWLPCLNHLGLGQNRLSCLQDLKFCVCLQSVDFGNNQISEIDSLLSVLPSCKHLQSILVKGNPFVEYLNYRNILSEAIQSLQLIDGETVDRINQPMSIEPAAWESVCLSQSNANRQLKEGYVSSLKNTDILSEMNTIHERFFETSTRIATDHRFAHEYGSSLSPQPPAFPKSSLQNGNSKLEKVKHQLTENLLQASTKQTIDMKSKFEQAVDMKSKSEQLSSRKTSIKPNTPSDMSSVRSADVRGSILEGGASFCAEERIKSSEKPENGKMEKSVLNGGNRSDSQPDHMKRYRSNDVNILMAAATSIQALWRGYRIRRRIKEALQYARFESGTDDDLEFPEVDLAAFVYNESEWILPETPRLPSNHPILGGLQAASHNPREMNPLNSSEFPTFPPKQAWRSFQTPSPFPLSTPPSSAGKPPLPPLSRATNTSEPQSTHRTKKEEQLAEEWGFKDSTTMELFLRRARKLEQPERKKKFNKLDPKQRLAVLRKMEENSQSQRPVVFQQKKEPPRIDYFRAMQIQEEERMKRESELNHQKEDYTYEWVHTQITHFENTSSRTIFDHRSSLLHRATIDAHPVSHLVIPLKRGGSEGSLPRIDPTQSLGRRANLVTSPSSAETSNAGDVKSRRLSINSDRFPPLGIGLAPIPKKDEKMSWRGQDVDKSCGWGSGQKRTRYK